MCATRRCRRGGSGIERLQLCVAFRKREPAAAHALDKEAEGALAARSAGDEGEAARVRREARAQRVQ